jgi:hypothetical protein
MRNLTRAAVLTAATALAGCMSWAPAPPAQVMKGPHEGTAIRLPGDKGFVELVNEPPVDSRGRNVSTSIVAYFLQPDGRSPLSPAPSDVRFEVAPEARKGAQTLPLAAAPKADDPAGAARFASKPGPYDLAALRGQLAATVGGQPVAVEIKAGR